MNPISMEERTQKLLILAGDEGHEMEARDFGKVVQIILEQYLTKEPEENSKQKILQIFTKVISKVPLKQHIYAGLTAKISQKNTEFSYQIIQISLHNLEQALNQYNFYDSINLLNYMSELMNISLLNSLTFMGLLQDIADQIEAQQTAKGKEFFISVLVRVLPTCLQSLSEKLHNDLKKLIDLLGVYAKEDNLLLYIKKQLNKSKIFNCSRMERLQEDFFNLPQYNSKEKLKLRPNGLNLQDWHPVNYHKFTGNEDQLYREFSEQEGLIHLLTVQQLIQTFYSKNSILNLKLNNYINSVKSHKQVFLYKTIISGLLAKALKSSRSIVQHSLLLNLVANFSPQTSNQIEEENSGLSKNDIGNILTNKIYEMFIQAETFDYNTLLKLADLISFIYNGWKFEWDWERYVEGEDKFVKRRILLILVLEKIKALNDHFVMPKAIQSISHYQTPEQLTNPHEYQTADDMESYEKFQTALKSKAIASAVKQMIKEEKEYEIFLQALFRRTSLSQTHLKTLTQRYKQILAGNQQNDWSLINKIRNFWKKSFLNRQLYLQYMIRQGFFTYDSYVKYINQLEKKDEKDLVWIRVELSQLNNLFGQNSKVNK